MDDRIIKKIESGREYRKTQDFAPVEPTGGASGGMIVQGYACTFNEPYTLYEDGGLTYREQIAPEAFDGCDMEDVIMQYDHAGRVFARRSNDTLKLSTDGHGLKTWARLDGTKRGQELYEEIAGGYTTKMSFGFIVAEDKEEITEDKAANTCDVLRTITKIKKLFDVSAVSLPANDATEITARNKVDGVLAKLEAERLIVENRNKQKQRIRILAEITKGGPANGL